MKKYWIITYGCQMNKSDSEKIAAVLENMKHKPASNIEKADLIVVNMCSVRQSAVNRVYGLIPKFKELKVKNKKLKTILTGCILKKDRKKFRKAFDIIWDNKNYFELPLKRQHQVAFIPISNGCNNFCTYCVVPFTRGPLICRNHQKILEEAKKVIQKGYKEIWLLGQNVNDYISPVKPPINFAKLLELVNNIPGNFQIRFISSHPKNFSEELIEVMAKSKKIARYLNLPVQSGNNQILKKMNRPYTVEQYKNLVKKIRKKIPNINLSTDVIVGFPGETERQFQSTVKLFREIKYNMAYVSKYSPRPGTVAFQTMKDNVSPKEKKRREKILKELIVKKQNV